MFFLGPTGPESSVTVSQPEESGCVNGIKRDTVDLCVCFGLGFRVMNGIWASSARWRDYFGLLLRQRSSAMIDGAILEDSLEHECRVAFHC